MVRQVASIVRASALRSRVFTLAKAWVEVWRVGEQEGELGLSGADRGANGVAFVTAEVVHDDHVAAVEGWDENLLDMAAEAHALDRSADDAGRSEAAAMLRSNEREGAPSPEGALWRRGVCLWRIGRRCASCWAYLSVVHKDKPPRINPRLTRLPSFAPTGDVCPVLFGGAEIF
jgi:hypothetical protein